jgi:hypothetical protein
MITKDMDNIILITTNILILAMATDKDPIKLV